MHQIVLPQPPGVKSEFLCTMLQLNKLRVFVETGTFCGATLEAVLPHVDRAVSIEIDPELYEKAKVKFQGDARVELHLGDSATVLPKILETLDQPALFWLDAHYIGARDESFAKVDGPEPPRGRDGDTPILAELQVVLDHNVDHIIAIDDARCFGVDPAYPRIAELISRAGSAGRALDVVLDIIFVGSRMMFPTWETQ